jgi:ATP-dependent DNA helicase RecG
MDEESEKIDLKDAITQYELLKANYPEIHFGLLHGKMKSEEKESIMEEFRTGKIQVLVSTTVIEVGVDVANANIIIIEHAERFGLSQLHQLRGRVGRGLYKSYCILALGQAVSKEAISRTQFMESTTDGFKVAEYDLELRGPGEILGTKQSGALGFALANLVRDQSLLQEARTAAFEVAARDSKLAFLEHAALKEELLRSHGPTALVSVG